MKGNLGESWGKLLKSQFLLYRGFMAEKSGNQWIWRDKSFSTIEGFRSAVDEYVASGVQKIGNSLNRLK